MLTLSDEGDIALVIDQQSWIEADKAAIAAASRNDFELVAQTGEGLEGG